MMHALRQHTQGLLVLCLFCLSAAISCAAFGQDEPAQEFLVIVHQDNPATSISVDDVARIFMKKRSSWGDWDVSTLPIDRQVDSELRETFSRAVHGKSVNALNSYWQRMIFSGRGVPPDTAPSDAAVFELVLKNPGAIAYAAPGTMLPDGVKELEITDE